MNEKILKNFKFYQFVPWEGVDISNYVTVHLSQVADPILSYVGYNKDTRWDICTDGLYFEAFNLGNKSRVFGNAEEYISAENEETLKEFLTIFELEKYIKK